MEDIYMEVYFDQYCKKCRHEKSGETEHPCDECLAEPMNLYSHTPVKFEEKRNEKS